MLAACGSLGWNMHTNLNNGTGLLTSLVVISQKSRGSQSSAERT